METVYIKVTDVINAGLAADSAKTKVIHVRMDVDDLRQHFDRRQSARNNIDIRLQQLLDQLDWIKDRIIAIHSVVDDAAFGYKTTDMNFSNKL